MRMISQQLAEEHPDYSLPESCTRPWLRRARNPVETNPVDPTSNDDVSKVLAEDGMAHVEK